MTSFLNHQSGRANAETRLMASFLNHQRERGFWLPWIRRTQENNRTPFHNNTCQIRTGLAHTTTNEVLKMLPEAAGRGQHFQARGHSFSLYGPTLSRQITYLFISCYKLAYNWVYATLSLNLPGLRAVYEPS